uniref:Uncharacterized protein n=1 Tax=Tetranychus urticae TaxID=32264 RepID=T1KJJ8_TETUR
MLLQVYISLNCILTFLVCLIHGQSNDENLEKILVPGGQPVLFMEQDMSWEDRKSKGWRLVLAQLKSKSSSSSSTTLKLTQFGGSSHPYWFRALKSCNHWDNYFETRQILQLIGSNVTVKYIPSSSMDEIVSACALAKRLKSPLSNQSGLQQSDQSKPEDETNIAELLMAKGKGSKVLLIKFENQDDEANREVKPVYGVAVHFKHETKASNDPDDDDTVKIDYCRVFNEQTVRKYLIVHPNISVISLKTESIEKIYPLCENSWKGQGTVTQLHQNDIKLFSNVIGLSKASPISFKEVDNESWQSKGTRNFLINVYTRTSARPFTWLLNNPDSLPQWSLVVDHCDIFSNPDVVDLFSSEQNGSPNYLVDRLSIKFLLNVCDHVNLN